ncbi:MAG TPA: FAD-dependent oxidoreductase [Nanoarchaeota archaeon]|nr:FAD-dependent oxidoreductase [Nanoarchaeota archaeon]
MYDLIIIGAGPAGCTAAIYAARYHLKAIMLYADMGQISYAHSVHNYPGIEEISGTELAMKMMQQAVRHGIDAKNEDVISVKKKGKYFAVKTSEGGSYESKAIILACGSKHRKLDAKGEKEFTGKGVSYCVTCDGPLFAGKEVAVAGSSDSAITAALMLAKYAKKVYILSRSGLKGEPVNVEQMSREKRIAAIQGVEIKEIKGERFVNSLRLSSGKELAVEGLFIEAGLEPSIGLAKQLKIKLDKGYIKADSEQKTNEKGVFAAGNITNRTRLKQIVTAAGEGAIAANSAYRFLNKR